MKAAVYHGPRDIRVEEVADPRIGAPDEILLENCFSGICGTDLHEFTSGPIVTPVEPHPLTGVTLPQVFGHEVSSKVVEVGSDVTDVKPGDRVSIVPAIICGKCLYCRQGMGHLCVKFAAFGLSAETGGMAKYAIAKEYQVAKLPDSVSDEEGALVEPAAVAGYGVERSGIRGGDLVLVTGAGPVGALAALYVAAVGAGLVIISEPNPNRAEKARALDIGPVLDPTSDGFGHELKDLTDGYGVDVSVECSGTTPGLSACIDWTRRAGNVVQLGLHTKPAALDGHKLAEKDLSLLGSWCWRMTDWPRIIRLISSGRFDVKKVLTRTIELDDVVAEGFEKLIDPLSTDLKILVKSA